MTSQEATPPVRMPISGLQIDGYRPFRNFSAELGELTVIIGANASGKSSLFDFLRFISRSTNDALPPEIDERTTGKTLFHGGGPEKFSFSMTVNLEASVALCYEAEVLGPVGSPKVSRELLYAGDWVGGIMQPNAIFLDFQHGQGVVREEQTSSRPPWTVKPNEFALRRALDPTLSTLSSVRELLSSFRFYAGFDTSYQAEMRRPVLVESEPVLEENGSNLSAVLMWMNRNHPETWDDLETAIRAVVPGFRSLNVKPWGGPGRVMGTWQEEGIPHELTLADLSDGTLRFLCWAVVCLSPHHPSVVCVDEPELGLHPRVLPILADLFRMASAHTQVLVATHSSYFLSQFKLQDIAVMRKKNGAAQWIRPMSSTALRNIVQEVGGSSLGQLHISDELEILP